MNLPCINNGPTPASFCLFSFFSNNFTEFGGIRTRIAGVEGEHADYLTSTPTQNSEYTLYLNFAFKTILNYIFFACG